MYNNDEQARKATFDQDQNKLGCDELPWMVVKTMRPGCNPRTLLDQMRHLMSTGSCNLTTLQALDDKSKNYQLGHVIEMWNKRYWRLYNSVRSSTYVLLAEGTHIFHLLGLRDGYHQELRKLARTKFDTLMSLQATTKISSKNKNNPNDQFEFYSFSSQPQCKSLPPSDCYCVVLNMLQSCPFDSYSLSRGLVAAGICLADYSVCPVSFQ
ncbi:hypothetical protein DFH28DRAFT_589121 [Melampsora americana]|nr:hypothetical protein DFH28DRAFT_589121 [Melampsora americana]